MEKNELLNVVPKVCSQALTRREKDRINLLHLENDDVFFVLDGLNQFVWNAIDGKKTVLQICEEVRKDQNVPEKFTQRFTDDVLGFFQKLKSKDLVTFS